MRFEIRVRVVLPEILRSNYKENNYCCKKTTYFKVWGNTRVRVRRYSGDKEALQNRELEVNIIKSLPQAKRF